MPKILKTLYYFIAAVAFFTLCNDIIILQWHSWDRHLFNILPIGYWIGIFEVALFSFLGGLSVTLALKSFLEIKKK